MKAMEAEKPRLRARVRTRRRAYVLMMSLGLLVLSASLMVAASRAALRHSTAARISVDELQHRWGTISCRTAVLPYADTILAYAEAERRTPLPLTRARIQLGGEQFDLTIADELAKANVNVLLDHTDRATAENRLRQALPGTMAMNLRLRPTAVPLEQAPATTEPAELAPRGTTKPTTIALPQWVSGFGQVFEDAAPQRLLVPNGGVRPAELLTCWGSGQVNLRRVTPTALKVVAPSLTAIERDRVLTARDAVFAGKPLPKPTTGPVDSDPIRRIVAAAGVSGARGVPSFVGNSACYSLWITSTDPRRLWHSYSVRDESVKDHVRTSAFEW